MVRYWSDGEAHIASYAPVPNIGWTVVVTRLETEVLIPARRSWHLALAGLGVSAVLALVTAVILARTLPRPVRELAMAAQAFGAGNVSAPLPTSKSDANGLSILVTTFAGIRQAVAEREATLKAHARQRGGCRTRSRGSNRRQPAGLDARRPWRPGRPSFGSKRPWPRLLRPQPTAMRAYSVAPNTTIPSTSCSPMW
jgi:HAMP domain-containing protein